MANAITGLGGLTTNTASTVGSSTLSGGRLATQQFMKILTSELSHQDPLQPLDNASLMQEMAAMQNLQNTSDMTSSIANLSEFLQLGSASSMIGKMVTGLNTVGSKVTGLVTGVTVSGGQVQLVINKNDNMPLLGVESIAPAA